MRKVYCIIAFITIHHLSVGQSFNWANTYGSIGIDQSYPMRTDGANNIYKSGRFEGNVDFDPSAGTKFLQSNGSLDIFISKSDEHGNLIWANSFGSTSSLEIGREIAIDNAANIYLTGAFGGTVDFDPSSSSTNLTAVSEDAFLVKFDSSGAFKWAIQFGGSGNEEAWSVSSDNSNNVYVSGLFSDSLTYTKGGVRTSISSSGSSDIFNAKVDSSGKIVWVHTLGGTGFDKGVSNIVSSDYNLYITGEYSGTVDFDPGSQINSISSNGNTDIFILKLDTSGTFNWVKGFGGSSTEVSKRITLSNNKKIIAVGSFRNTVDFDPSSSIQSYSSNGDEEMFIEVLDQNGNFEWARVMGGFSRDAILGVETDVKNNIYTTGFFFNTVDFDPGLGTTNLTAQGLADSFIQKLDSNGDFIWVKHFKSNGDVVGTSMKLIDFTNLILTGSYEQTADFDPNSTTFNLSSNGNRDCFMLSLNVCDTIRDSLIVNSCDSFQSPSGKYTWRNSGIYFDTLTNVYGCDSILRYDLFIDSIKFDTLNLSSCDTTFNSPSGNKVWTSSGTYQDTIQNASGCDSILTVELSLNSSSAFFMNQSSCGSYVAPSGKTYFSGGLFYDTIPNAKGCDSVITIFLNLKSNSTSSQTITACGSYISPTNKLYTSSGTYFDTLQNSVGCDSVITTTLTINTLNNSVFQTGNQLIANQNNVSYQWLDCNNNYALLSNDTNQTFSSFYSGSYAVEISDSNCTDTSNCINLIVTSLKNKIIDQDIEIYPNPTSDILYINGSIRLQNLKMITLDGKTISLTIISENSISTASLPNGIYILEYFSGGHKYLKKIIVNHN